jgi:branched-subunit amino acid permease
MTDGSRWTLRGTSFEEREFTNLWFLATATYGVGDVVTTIALIHFSDTVNEANVLVRVAVETFGQAGLVGLKLVVLLACLAISVAAANDEDAFTYYLPPLALAVVGAFTTTYNVRLLLG